MRLARLLICLAALVAPCMALGATHVVINSATSGPGSLADALDRANTVAGLDTITFDIPGPGPHEINQVGFTVSDALLIDGYSQPGAVQNTNDASNPWNGSLQIVISGLGLSGSTFTFTAENVEVRGLVFLYGSGDYTINAAATGDQHIHGCFFAVDPDGNLVQSGGSYAVHLQGSANTLGGADSWKRNVINGSSWIEGDGNIVRGNLFGLGPDGESWNPNVSSSRTALHVSGNSNIIGGAVIGGRNTSAWRIYIAGDINIIRRNSIGTDLSTTLLRAPDSGFAIWIVSGDGNIIGGRVNGGNNVIGGFDTAIRVEAEATNTIIRRNSIGIGNFGSDLGGEFSAISVYGSGTQIGGAQPNDGNTITNYGQGVGVNTYGPGVTIRGNRIFGNQNGLGPAWGLGIDLGGGGVTENDPGDLDAGPNDLLNFPVITALDRTSTDLTVYASYEGPVGASFDIEFFLNDACDPSGYGEGETLVRTETAVIPPSGLYETSFTLPLSSAHDGSGISATATDALGSTSEFSACADVVLTRVVNLNDDGYGSLRSALEYSNAHAGRDSIVIEVAGVIPLLSALPEITDPLALYGTGATGDVIAGALLPPATPGLVVSADECHFEDLALDGFLGAGGFELHANEIAINDCSVSSSTIGVDQQEGTAHVEQGHFLGGAVGIWMHGAGGSITGANCSDGTTGIIVQADGVSIHRATCQNNSGNGIWVRSGVVGTDISWSNLFENQGYGLLLEGSGCQIVGTASQPNSMTFNAMGGVGVLGGSGNLIRGNVIALNGDLDLDLGNDGVTLNDPLDADTGANELLNFPELTMVELFGPGCRARVSGVYHGKPNTEITIDVYANGFGCNPLGYGGGTALVATIPVLTDANGDASFQQCLASGSFGDVWTAQASDATNSSEFSQCMAPIVTGVEDPGSSPGANRIYAVHPNPSWSQSTISFEVAGENTPVEIAFFDVRGRLVRRFDTREYGPGRHAVLWDRRDDHSGLAAAGVYFLRVRIGEASFQRKLVLLD